MRIFEYGDFKIVCNSESTRSGFRHIATLLKNGREIEKTKICYLNRTWESFEFESILNKLINQNEELKLITISEKI